MISERGNVQQLASGCGAEYLRKAEPSASLVARVWLDPAEPGREVPQISLCGNKVLRLGS